MNLEGFQQFTRALPEAHLLVDSNGLILSANRAAGELLRMASRQVAGKHLSAFVRDEPERLRGILERAASSGDLIPTRLQIGSPENGSSLRAGAGVVLPATAGTAAVILLRIEHSDQGSPFMLLTRKIDELSAEIRRRMGLEQERAELLRSERQAREQAEEANRVKDEFLATLSHELRTPLNAILGWAAMLRSGDVSADKYELALRTMERAARSQAQLVEDLLDFSRIMAGRLRLDVRAVNVSEVVEAAAETVRPTAELKEISLDAVLDPAGGPVSGDPDRLQQVVWNLLSNAIKFTPRGGRVQVRVERVNSHVEIVVTDNGEGIPRDFLPHIFDRFRQADASHSRAHGGVGLGLSIARHLIEAHAGFIHAASDGPGKGATFTVVLPVAVYDPPHALVPNRVHPAADLSDSPPTPLLAADALRGLDIVVVEDHEDSRTLLAALLEGRGARVRFAAVADEARAQLTDRLPDLILADIELPGEDGYTFLRKLRMEPAERGGRVPAIAVTAFSRRIDRLRALDAGFQMHLPKPVEPTELIAVIRAVTAGA